MHAIDHHRPDPNGLFIEFLHRCAGRLFSAIGTAIGLLRRRNAALGPDDDIEWDDGEAD